MGSQSVLKKTAKLGHEPPQFRAEIVFIFSSIGALDHVCVLVIVTQASYHVPSFLFYLTDYDKKKTAEIPKMLEDYINHLAKTGDTLFPWSKVKSVIRHKLELVIANFREICPTENLPPCPNVEPFHYETMRDKILVQFDSFNWYFYFLLQVYDG